MSGRAKLFLFAVLAVQVAALLSIGYTMRGGAIAWGLVLRTTLQGIVVSSVFLPLLYWAYRKTRGRRLPWYVAAIFMVFAVSVPMERYFWPYPSPEQATSMRLFLGTCLAVVMYAPVFVAVYFGAGNSRTGGQHEAK